MSQTNNKRAAKLTPKDVRYIRRTKRPADDLALKYNMSLKAITDILRRRTWQ